MHPPTKQHNTLFTILIMANETSGNTAPTVAIPAALRQVLRRTGNITDKDMIVTQIEAETRMTLIPRMPFFQKGDSSLSQQVSEILRARLEYSRDQWDPIWNLYAEATVRKCVNHKRSAVTQRVKNAVVKGK